MVDGLEVLNLVLQVCALQPLLDSLEQLEIGLLKLQSGGVLLEINDVVLSRVHTSIELLDLTRMQIKYTLVINGGLLNHLTVLSQSLRVIDDGFVELFDLVHENLTLLLVSLLQL